MPWDLGLEIPQTDPARPAGLARSQVNALADRIASEPPVAAVRDALGGSDDVWIVGGTITSPLPSFCASSASICSTNNGFPSADAVIRCRSVNCQHQRRRIERVNHIRSEGLGVFLRIRPLRRNLEREAYTSLKRRLDLRLL